MAHSNVVVYFSPDARPAPAAVRKIAERNDYALTGLSRITEVTGRVSRAYPVAIILDGTDTDQAVRYCVELKTALFNSLVPIIVDLRSTDPLAPALVLEAGADEVLIPTAPERENDLRLEIALRRAERDVSVHPTTRLPGTVQIERDFAERLRRGEKFAVCYADLDHFKEFNDRYGYNHGDTVILILSRILRDVVGAWAPGGFVGHIGGDDFIFTVPVEQMESCCALVIEVFGELIPLQYTEADRAKGWFAGKDRRGNEYEVPLMSLSIGVVTNAQRTFTHTAQISELATEMKTYAKTFPGSLFVVDRRGGNASPPAST